MRITFAAIALLAAGAVTACGSVQSPDNCCVTDAQCAEINAAEPIPCDDGLACGADHTCVAAQCQTSDDCDAAAPICRLGFCESTCSIDDDCADVSGRTHCSPAGACVGCVDSSQCGGDTAICDADENVCRGCERDDECASGVCIEAEGTCALEADVIYVNNGTDAGSCTRAAPCRSLGYALSRITVAAGSRNVIRVESGLAPTETATLAVSLRVVIDGTGTTVTKPSSTTPWMTITAPGQVVLDGLVITGTSDLSNPAISVSSAALHVGPDVIVRGAITNTSGTVLIDRARVESSLSCNNGTLDVQRANIDVSARGVPAITGGNCLMTVNRSRITGSSDDLLDTMGGKVIVENNLFVNTFELSDSIRITSVSSGSRFRFNTVANLSGIDSDGTALSCDGTLDVTSNIFAYRSQHPLSYGAGCHAKFSVFDDHTGTLPTPATDSVFVPFGSIFTDPVTRDFTLSSASAARGAADPSIQDVQVDLAGMPRPSPAGSTADSGAFEAN